MTKFYKQYQCVSSLKGREDNPVTRIEDFKETNLKDFPVYIWANFNESVGLPENHAHEVIATWNRRGLGRYQYTLVEPQVELQTYRVRISHDVVEECEVEVEASSEEEAIEMARVMDTSEQDWQLTDFIGDNQYDIMPD